MILVSTWHIHPYHNDLTTFYAVLDINDMMNEMSEVIKMVKVSISVRLVNPQEINQTH